MSDSTDAFVVEMIRRGAEMRKINPPTPRPRPALKSYQFAWDIDIALFESAMDALYRSELEPDNGYVAEAVPSFAALLTRVVEQTAAEFGPKAAQLALRWMADAMGDRC